MAETKKYISLTGIRYTFPVSIDGKPEYVSFKGPDSSYVTSNSDIQKALEKHAKFKNGEIGLSDGESKETGEDTDNGGGKTFEPMEYPSVTDFQGAVETLRKNPYKVHNSKLKDPAALKEQASICNALFPNLNLD